MSSSKCRFAWTALILLGLFADRAWAQWTDSFEGGEPRWGLVESDCNAQLTAQEISLLMPHGGRTCELLELACGHGTMALLAYPIEPCAIIEEFSPRVWTRCSSGRIRIGARVIFPFAAHPVTGGRLTTILWGTAYTDTGQWQMLEIESIMERMREELVAIRQRFGGGMRLEGAYIDCIVVNAFTGPGRYRLQLDDLDLRGMVTMAAAGSPPPENWRQEWRWRYELPSPEEKYWSSPNSPSVWLQDRGEQLAWLKSLGFTGVVTDKLPSRQRLAEASQADLAVISPPPSYAIEFPEESLNALKGWLIGAALDSRQASVAREQAQRVAGLPATLHKPLVAEAMEDFFQFSRVADEVIVPQPLAIAAGTARQKSVWLSQQLDTTKQRSSGWVSVNLGIPPNLAAQLQTAAKIVTPEADVTELAADPTGFRQQVVASVMAGARGFLLRTFHPLDIQSKSDSAQIAALRWLQNDLRLWGPWIASGQVVPPPVLNDSSWLAAAWRISESQLVIAQTVAEGSQFCVPPTAESPLEFGLPTSATGQQVFRLTGGTLERLTAEASPAGLAWRVERPAPVESFLICSDPTILRFARRHLAATLAQNAADQLEITTHNLGLAANLVESHRRRLAESDDSTLPQDQALGLAQRQIDGGVQAIRTQQSVAAIGLLYEASNTIQSVLYDGYQNASGVLASPQSSPLISTPATLHLHWAIADACARSQWQDRLLPGADFMNLSHMLEQGWSQQRRLEERVHLRVELVPPTTQSNPGLRLAAYAHEPDSLLQGGFEGASLRVRSAATQVKAGQLVRVSALARILSASDQLGSGLLIYDNQVGPSLGQLVSGSQSQLVPVELYRFAVADGEFRLLAECRGECDIVLEAVRLSVIQPATNRRSYDTNPLDSFLWDSSP